MSTQAITSAIAPVVESLNVTVTGIALAPARSWYVINLQKDSDEAEILIYEPIGMFGINAERFVKDLQAIDAKTINLRLNTPGGEVFDATAIYNALRNHPARIVAHIDGLAASAGSVIAMSADEIRMADNAYLMIHEAHGGVMGEAEEMRKYADLLEKINDNIAGSYQKKAGKSRKYWRGKMADETWFTAAEAKGEGLIDKVVEASKKAESARAQFDFKIYNQAKIPDAVKAAWGINQTVKPAPEHSPSGEPAQALTKEVSPMGETNTLVAPAPTSAAGNQSVSQSEEIQRIQQITAQGWQEQGRKLGAAEAREAELKRMKDIVEACPGNAELAVQAFLSGQTAATVRIAFEAAAKEKAMSQAAQAAKDVEIARLNALIAIGGHAGVAMAPSGTTQGIGVIVPPETDPEVQAKMEWDGDPSVRQGCTEKQWMLFRVNQLKGGVRALKRQVA